MNLKKLSAVTLTNYQEDLKKKLQTRHGMIVAWGLGSGKTIGSIAAADQFGQAKAVVPASLRENFRKGIRSYKPKNKVTVESYEKFTRNPEDVKDKTVIFDEAHRLRTSDSKRSQLAQDLASKAKKVLLLTGTPIQNAPHEIAPLVNIAAGHKVLPTSQKEFNDRFIYHVKDNPGMLRRAFGAKAKDEFHGKNLQDFRAIVKPYYTEHKGTADPTVPKVHERTVNVEMSPVQTKVYHTLEKQLPGRIRKTIESNLPAKQKDISRLNSFLSATRQVSNSNEKFYVKGEKQYSPKLLTIAKNVAKSPGKALIYSNYLDSGVTPISELLTKQHISHGIFTGKLKDAERRKLVNAYNKDKLKALIVSSSGGEGLDLKGTRQVHITEPHWNSAKIDQVIGRSARKGSHGHLPEKDRTVDVFKYQSMLPEQRTGFLWLKKKRPIAADQYLQNMSERKEQLNKEFLHALK